MGEFRNERTAPKGRKILELEIIPRFVEQSVCAGYCGDAAQRMILELRAGGGAILARPQALAGVVAAPLSSVTHQTAKTVHAGTGYTNG